MALLQVHEFLDPILQQHAMPVTVFDDKLRQLAAACWRPCTKKEALA